MVTIEKFDLTNYNSYHIKAICDKVCFPENDADLAELFSNGEEKVILGGGYNIILSKPEYRETFVIFDSHFAGVEIVDNRITARAGVSMQELSQIACDNALSGLEVFYDIPSSLGGAVVMNAGASGEEIKDILVSVKYFDPDAGTFNEKYRDDISFEYRNSFFQKNPHLIITEAVMDLRYGIKEEIQAKMEAIKAARWAKQPKEYPNAGSVFKRPPGRFVGPMIEQLGLKGFSIGGAKVSEKHAGFVINHNGATGHDIITLIEYVKDKVRAEFEVDLEIEQRII